MISWNVWGKDVLRGGRQARKERVNQYLIDEKALVFVITKERSEGRVPRPKKG